MIANLYRGTALGIAFAVLVLMTDAFGIFILISAQSAPVTTALIFVLNSSLNFLALTIVVAASLVACSK